MKNKTHILILIFAILLGQSCNSKRVYRKYLSDFPDYHWSSKNICEFSPNIKDTDKKYNLYFLLRHIYGFQNPKININVEIVSPSGQKTVKDYEIKVIANKNEYVSDCTGGLCDLSALIEKDYKFAETGVYSVKIKNTSVLDPLLNVMEIGLEIETAE